LTTSVKLVRDEDHAKATFP